MMFLSGSIDRTIKLWDINQDKPIRPFRGHSNWVRSVCQMSPTTFLSGSRDNTIKLWDINHDEAIRTFRGHSNWVRSVSNVTNNISFGSDDRTIKLWDINHDEPIRTFEGHTGGVESVLSNVTNNIPLRRFYRNNRTVGHHPRRSHPHISGGIQMVC